MRDDEKLSLSELVEAEYFLLKSFQMQPSEMLSMPSIDMQFLVMKESNSIKQNDEEKKMRDMVNANTASSQRTKVGREF